MNPHLSKNAQYGKVRSLILVKLAYWVALAAAAIGFYFVRDWGPIWGILSADLIATVVIWAIGARLMNASLYDPYWSVIPPVIMVYWWSLSGFEMSANKLMMMAVILWWSVRLTTNWARDWPGLHHEDWRYQEMRADNPKLYQVSNLFGICIFPTVLVFLAVLPAYPVLSSSGPSNLVLDIIACLAGLSAATIQLFADGQMRHFRFKKTEGQAHAAFFTGGLWAFSRHPNYFGEVLMWFSLWLFALSAGWQNAWTCIGWIAMLALFLFVSCPWMDRRSAAKRDGYADYIKTSSMFFPTWPKRR